MGLRELLDKATPGDWTFHNSTDRRGHKGEFRGPSPHNGFMLVGPWTNDHDARLMALSRETTALLVDAMDWIEDGRAYDPAYDDEMRSVRARYSALKQKAGKD